MRSHNSLQLHWSRFLLLLGGLFPIGCSSETSRYGGGGGESAATAKHSITVQVVFTPDPDGFLHFPTQNGSMVLVPSSEVVGTTSYWVVTPGGEPPGNATPIEQVSVDIAEDLTATFSTGSNYSDGIWEVAGLVAVSGVVPVSAPSDGDLAAFDISAPLAGEPAQTGQTVRVRIDGGDASLLLTNEDFIRVGAP